VTPRSAIVAGLGSGAAVAIVLLIAFAAFVPGPDAAVASGSPGTSAEASSPPSDGPAGSPSIVVTPRASLIVAGFHIGEPAPALKIPQLGGGEIDLTNLQGQPLWINFMATYCPSCRDEFALMNGFAARYADTGLIVIAVDVREDETTMAGFVLETNPIFPIGLDLDGAAQEAWDAPVLPVHFWIDRDGIIRAGALGGIGPDIMASHLQTILPGVEVTP